MQKPQYVAIKYIHTVTVFVEFNKYFISLDSASYKNGIVFISFSHIFLKFRWES